MPDNDLRSDVAADTQPCHAQRDGDCIWQDCPQNRDGEPGKSGRHCPLDTGDPDHA